MPLGAIKELDAAEKLETAWIRELEYPRDAEVIKRMAPADFRSWVYWLHPTAALVLSQIPEFAEIQRRKRNVFWNVVDYFWRLKHDYR